MHALNIRVADNVHETMTALAEARGMSAEDLCAEVMYRLTKAIARDPIAELWSHGYTDAEIADRLGIVKHSVSTRRRGLHLPPNTPTPQKASA